MILLSDTVMPVPAKVDIFFRFGFVVVIRL